MNLEAGLPTEMLMKLGIDLKGLEPEAEDIWKGLEELSKDPVGYENFIRQHLPNVNDRSGAEEKGSFFRPVIGFCIYTRTTGGDGLKVRTIDGGRNLYVNLCSYKGISQPKNNRGQIVKEFYEKDLEIPLVIGPVRYEDDIDSDENKCIVIDVILHVSVIDHCNVNNSFKREVVDLALTCIESERKVLYRKDWKILSKSYSFGRGRDKLTPVLFPLNNDALCTEKKDLNNPSNLLNEVLKTREPLEGLSNLCTDINDNNVYKNNNTGNDVHVNFMSNVKKNSQSDMPSSKLKSNMKKGFLEKNAGALYPNGLPKSNIDDGGPLARIMDKCQVVDLNNRSDGSAVLKNLNDPKIKTSNSDEDNLKRPSKLESMIMDDLMASLDDEYGFSSNKSKVSASDNDFTTQLSNLAKAFVKDDFEISSPSMQAPSLTSADLKTITDSQSLISPKLKIKHNTCSDDKRINIENNAENHSIFIKIENLDMKMSDIDINISLDEVRINLPGNIERLSLFLENGQIDKNKVEASFSKKAKNLKIKLYVL